MFFLVDLCKGTGFIYWDKQPVACRPVGESTLGCPLNRKLLTSSLNRSSAGSWFRGCSLLWGIIVMSQGQLQTSSSLPLHTTACTDFRGERWWTCAVVLVARWGKVLHDLPGWKAGIPCYKPFKQRFEGWIVVLRLLAALTTTMYVDFTSTNKLMCITPN